MIGFPCLVLLLAGLALAGGDPVDDGGEAPVAVESPSPWYLLRGTGRRESGPLDDIPAIAFELAEQLRDGVMPGFYDGQFTSTADRFDELARLARDPDIHATLRIVAIMALQEAGHGEQLREALEPLLLDPAREFAEEYDGFLRDFNWRSSSEEEIRGDLAVRISQYARWSLAKDGQTGPILAKIQVMRDYVTNPRVRERVLDPGYRSSDDLRVLYDRQVWFDIGYYYQQFDDFEHARKWFGDLCEHLPPGQDTRMPRYNLACIAALQGRPDEAMAQLQAAVDGGFVDVAWMDEDGDLASLRDRADYRALRARLGGLPAEGTGDGNSDVSEPAGP